MKSMDLRLQRALQACERRLAAGMAPRSAIESAAHLHAVDPCEVAVRLVEKRVAAERAYAAAMARLLAADPSAYVTHCGIGTNSGQPIGRSARGAWRAAISQVNKRAGLATAAIARERRRC